MKKHKLIAARNAKKWSQEKMATMVGMSQSQYQRRESGEISISDDEWARIAKQLGREVEEIKEDDNVVSIYNYGDQSGNYSANSNYFYNIPEYIMKNQQDYIEMLKAKIINLEDEIRILKETHCK